MIIGAAKKKLAAKKATAAAAAPAATTPQYLCGTPDQATAAMQASQAQASGQQPKMDAKSMLASTPQGMMVTGAIAAAPMAGDAARKLGGFLRGKQNNQTMRKDLARGRLQLKGIRFVDGGDEMATGFEKDIELLKQALETVEGQFLLNVPPESDGQSPPDTLMAIRRLTRLSAHLQVAGIPHARVTVRGVFPAGLDPKSEPPKPGQARAEIVRIPAEIKQ